MQVTVLHNFQFSTCIGDHIEIHAFLGIEIRTDYRPLFNSQERGMIYTSLVLYSFLNALQIITYIS